MGFKVGDSYFNRDGYPGVVLGRDPRSQALIVEKQGPEYEKTRKVGYINGLEPEQRAEFEAIINEMRTQPGTRERLGFIHQKIEGLKYDPTKQVLVRYLEGEMSHLMYSAGISPRVYTIDETKT